MLRIVDRRFGMQPVAIWLLLAACLAFICLQSSCSPLRPQGEVPQKPGAESGDSEKGADNKDRKKSSEEETPNLDKKNTDKKTDENKIPDKPVPVDLGITDPKATGTSADPSKDAKKLVNVGIDLRLETSFFNQKIQPIFERSCLEGGCHSSAENIDLRTFPLRAEGSWAMDLFLEENPNGYSQQALQDYIADVILQSVDFDSGTMPPSENLTPLEVEAIDDWARGEVHVWPSATLVAEVFLEARSEQMRWELAEFSPEKRIEVNFPKNFSKLELFIENDASAKLFEATFKNSDIGQSSQIELDLTCGKSWCRQDN